MVPFAIGVKGIDLVKARTKVGLDAGVPIHPGPLQLVLDADSRRRLLMLQMIVEEERLRRAIIWDHFELRGILTLLPQVRVNLILLQTVDSVHRTILVFTKFGIFVA